MVWRLLRCVTLKLATLLRMTSTPFDPFGVALLARHNGYGRGNNAFP